MTNIDTFATIGWSVRHAVIAFVVNWIGLELGIAHSIEIFTTYFFFLAAFTYKSSFKCMWMIKHRPEEVQKIVNKHRF